IHSHGLQFLLELRGVQLYWISGQGNNQITDTAAVIAVIDPLILQITSSSLH
ncbi:hypothetical protein ACJX0J_030851, partial [Zea mays]